MYTQVRLNANLHARRPMENLSWYMQHTARAAAGDAADAAAIAIARRYSVSALFGVPAHFASTAAASTAAASTTGTGDAAAAPAPAAACTAPALPCAHEIEYDLDTTEYELYREVAGDGGDGGGDDGGLAFAVRLHDAVEEGSADPEGTMGALAWEGEGGEGEDEGEEGGASEAFQVRPSPI